MTAADHAQDLATLRALKTAVEYLLAGGMGRDDEIKRLLADSQLAFRRVETALARKGATTP